MEKAINLVMNADKTIVIFVNEEEKHKIEAEKRSISANEIYRIIDFSAEDRYTVTSKNENNVNSNVLDFFTELLSDIAKKVNALQVGNDSVKTADIK